mgnify:CR=1 FL=1
MAEPGMNDSRNESDRDKRSPLISIVFNFLWIAAAIALIIGSFWISFLFGRRVLLPIRKTNNPEIVKTISVPVMEVPKEKLPLEQKKIVVPDEPKTGRKDGENSNRVVLAKLFRVQIAKSFKKDDAINLMKDLQAKGFDVFAKNLYNENWIVQIGAFKDKGKALKVIRDLKSKGISNKILIKEEN